MNDPRIEQVHITSIRAGDTVRHDGKDRTVCQEDIKWSPFMGTTLFGCSYSLGEDWVEKVIYEGVRYET